MATFKPIVFNTKNHIKSDGTTNIKIEYITRKNRNTFLPNIT